MITYRGHIVYVVATDYPTIAATSAVARAATKADVHGGQPLGVLSDGRCVPLSSHEVAEVRRKYPTDFSVRYRRGALVHGVRGYDFEISDHRGFVIFGGWSAGKRVDAEQDAKAKLIELRAKPNQKTEAA